MHTANDSDSLSELTTIEQIKQLLESERTKRKHLKGLLADCEKRLSLLEKLEEKALVLEQRKLLRVMNGVTNFSHQTMPYDVKELTTGEVYLLSSFQIGKLKCQGNASYCQVVLQRDDKITLVFAKSLSKERDVVSAHERIAKDYTVSELSDLLEAAFRWQQGFTQSSNREKSTTKLTNEALSLLEID